MPAELLVRAALWAGAAVLLLAGLLLATVIAMRLALVAADRRRERVKAVWRPILAGSLAGMPESLPPLAPRDLLTVLGLWSYYQASLQGEAREGLNALARQAGLDAEAARLLDRGGVRETLLAATVLGYLRDPSRWETLKRMLFSANPFLSLAAAQALLAIDPATGMRLLVPLILFRPDWPSSRVAAFLKQADPDIISPPLAFVAADALPEQAPRIIRYLEFARRAEALGTVRGILARAPGPEITMACLHVLGGFSDPGDLEAVRGHLAHPSWGVKVQAAAVLGRMGTLEDEPRLAVLLSDREWWVRYRAAQALADLPAMRPEGLVRLRAVQTDRFARDILTQVMAERGIP